MIASTSCAGVFRPGPGNLKGQDPGRRPTRSRDPRSDHYPNKPVKTGLGPSIFGRGGDRPRLITRSRCPFATGEARPYVQPGRIDPRRLPVFAATATATACEANAKASAPT